MYRSINISRMSLVIVIDVRRYIIEILTLAIVPSLGITRSENKQITHRIQTKTGHNIQPFVNILSCYHCIHKQSPISLYVIIISVSFTDKHSILLHIDPIIDPIHVDTQQSIFIMSPFALCRLHSMKIHLT